MGLSGMGFVAVLFALLFVVACGETATPEPEPVDCSQAKCTFSLSHEDRCFVTIEGEDAPACDYRYAELCPKPGPSNPCRRER